MIDPAFRALAEAGLDRVEREEGVRVVLGVESGSRAWGFASNDSDYDVRFVYVRPLADYLAVEPLRDVIERPIDGVLDLGGWDLRKALALMARSNAVVLEWLGSPVVYRHEAAVVSELVSFGRAWAHLPALEYHYDRLARSAWTEEVGPIRVKQYFYALRPAFALMWLRAHGTAAPMDLPSLMAGVAVSDEVRGEITALLAVKEGSGEAATVARCQTVETFLASVLATRVGRPDRWEQGRGLVAANALFRRIVGG